MSWFSNITSRAEALLEKIDQDAAQALQNPEGILKGTKLINQAWNSTEYYTSHEGSDRLDDARNQLEDDHHIDGNLRQIQIQTSENIPTTSNDTVLAHEGELFVEPQRSKLTPNDRINEDRSQLLQEQSDKTHSNDISDSQQVMQSYGPSTDHSGQSTNSSEPTRQKLATDSKTYDQKRKFKLQAVKLKLTNSTATPSNEIADKARLAKPQEPVADEIRASIHQALRSYTPSHNSRTNQQPNYRYQTSSPTASSSFYDNQPNLIYESSPSRTHRSNGVTSIRRNDSSESISINVPERSSSNIASQILRQSVSNRKSAFSLHKVINRLSNGRSSSIFDDRTKMRLRQAQARIASYLQRLNYYLRAYPKLKYWIIIYLVILQVLCVYVLFFYRATSSSTYLSSQIREQQEDLYDPVAKVSSSKPLFVGSEAHRIT